MKNYKYDKIRTYFFINKKSAILASISGILFDGLMAFVPIFQGRLLDKYKEQADPKYIILFAICFLLFVFFIQINRFFKRYYIRDFSNRMTLQMRKICFHNLIHQNIADFNNSSKGDIMNKNLLDINDASEGVRKVFTEVFDSGILMLSYIISLMILDYKISLIIIAFLFLSILLSNLLKNIVYKTSSSFKKEFSKSKDETLNCLQNEIYYRGLGVSNRYAKKFENEQNILERKSIIAMIFKSSMEPIYNVVALLGLIFVVYYNGLKVIDNIWLIGTFSAYLTTYTLLATKTSKVGKLVNAISSLKVSWNRCLPYLRNTNFQNMENFEFKNDMLEVNNLSFGFDSSFSVNNISFKLKNNESLAICGMVHTGKSTLLAALSSIYKYQGSVKLCGIELSLLENAQSSFISYGSSQVEIFNDTLKYNISFCDDADISDVLKYTCLSQELNENMVLSHSNINLSGGQMKRIQIARSIYAKPKLILLDDPYNAIDIEMAIKINKNILSNYKNSYFIIVNNQKEILKEMSNILFLKDNTYLFGKYEELLKDSDFKKLVREE